MKAYRFEKHFLIPIWSMILPFWLVSCFLMLLLYAFDAIYFDDDFAAIFFNIATLLSIIYLSGWVINLFILSPIHWIKGKIHDRYLDKHPEKCTSTEQLAQDFEKLAEALRESDKENKQ